MSLTKQAIVSEETLTELFAAARAGNSNYITEILDSGVNLESKTSKGYTALMLAAYNGHYQLTQELVTRGANVNSVDQSGNSILMGVVFKGHSSIFNLLISSSANFDYQNPKKETALDYAIMFGRRDLITKLNRLMNTARTDNKIEQIKTWARHVNHRLKL